VNTEAQRWRIGGRVQGIGYRPFIYRPARSLKLIGRVQSRVNRVGSAGGVFQKQILTEQAQVLRQAAGFEVLIPQRLPLNDAAFNFGQIIAATALHAVGMPKDNSQPQLC
jgi:hydrogenase maturation factor HypF (carbamoyltransferase family)